MEKTFEELKTRLNAIHDLRVSRAILGWDQHTKMPPKGAEVRAEALSTLDRLSHDLFVDDEIGRLLEELRPYEESLYRDSNEASLLRVTRRDYDKAKRVPSDLRAEMTRAGAIALPAWVEAREKSDFSIFLPYLKRNVELQHEYIACFDGMGYETAYDVLLDDFDEGMTAETVRGVFDELKRELVPLIAEIQENADRVDDSSLHGDFPIEFTDTHDLGIDFLVDEAIDCLKSDVADLDHYIDALRLAPVAQSLALEARGFTAAIDGL